MQAKWSDIPEIIDQKVALRLAFTNYTATMPIETRLRGDGFYQAMHGPYLDADDPEMMVFVVESIHGEDTTYQLLVRDCEGDFLNSNAEGAEKYNVGVVR